MGAACYTCTMPDAAPLPPHAAPVMRPRPRRTPPGTSPGALRRRLPSPCPAPSLDALAARSPPHALLLTLAEIAPRRASRRVGERVLGVEALRRAPQWFGRGEKLAQVDTRRVRRGLARLGRLGLAERDGAQRWHVTARVRVALQRWRRGESDDVLAGRFARYGRARKMATQVDARLAREATGAAGIELRDAA